MIILSVSKTNNKSTLSLCVFVYDNSIFFEICLKLVYIFTCNLFFVLNQLYFLAGEQFTSNKIIEQVVEGRIKFVVLI